MTPLVLSLGLSIVVAVALQDGLRRVRVPPLVGYLLLGVLLRASDVRWGWLGARGLEIYELLGQLGVVVLLFRVGLDSRVRALLAELEPASLIWISNVLISATGGFLVAQQMLGLDDPASLTLATALTATSVGVPVAVWKRKRALDSREGRLLLDVAELDDIAAIVLMGMLFAVLPRWSGGLDGSLGFTLARVGALYLLKLGLFVLGCLVLSRYVEPPLTAWLQAREQPPHPMLSMVGVAIVIASVAGLLGFSLAIGAFFAGLVYSRDPKAVRMERSFDAIYDLLTPFFFIAVGLRVTPTLLTEGAHYLAPLAAVAIVSKWVGTALPAWHWLGGKGASRVGISMVPRAEISMIVMQRALELDEPVVSQELFAAMVGVCIVTCIAGPLVLQHVLPEPQDTSDTE